MSKTMKKSQSRQKKERQAEHIRLILAALEAGHTSRRAICNATGIKIHELTLLFAENREAYAAYTVRRRTLVDTAADNLQDIIDDPNHPQHFAASKYVLQKYKSDLDTILESQDSEEVEINLGGKSTANPVVIKFGGR